MGNIENICDIFREKAGAVSAVVSDVPSLQAAFAYAADLCRQKAPVQGQATGNGGGPGPAALQRIVAAPGLAPGLYAEFEALCRQSALTLIDDGLRDHPDGIDMGFTIVDFAIAETGTLVLNCPGEALRLATMISEVHVAVVPKAKIRCSADDLEPELLGMFKARPDYTAFITGASRTADIERVLALGVHGPLELHILLMEDH